MVCQWVVEHFGIIDALFLAAAATTAAAAAAAAALSCHCTLSQGARSNISNHFKSFQRISFVFCVPRHIVPQTLLFRSGSRISDMFPRGNDILRRLRNGGRGVSMLLEFAGDILAVSPLDARPLNKRQLCR